MSDATTIAWFHCFCGIAGDMAMGSLIDAGADLDEVRALCDRVPVDGWELVAKPVLRGGIAATDVKVITHDDDSVHRTAAHISAMIDEARLPDRVRDRALATFQALAEAEGKLHRRPAASVHFHEVGGLDAIIDVVGTCAALEVLGIDEVHASAIAQGKGMVRAAHGLLPVPAPATVELLRNAPSYGTDISMELTTPTGAALLAANAVGWGNMPAMTIEASGFGAGDRELPDRPNVTQVIIGSAAAVLADGQPITLVEANVDDATGETLADAIAMMLEAGAADAWLTPIVMKKGRPAYTVSALADAAVAEQVAAVMRAETGTLGVRARVINRWPSAREMDRVEVHGRAIRVKVSPGRTKVEHDDAARAARHLGIPVREVVSLAEEASRRGRLQSAPEPEPPSPDDDPTIA